jgi:uracil-DNA glycosylase
MKDVVFLGSNPARCSNSIEPFANCKSGVTLKEEWIPKLGINNFTIMNVSNYATPNNKPLSTSVIEQEIPRLLSLLQNKIVIALGRQALQAVNLCKSRGLICEVIDLPHPSKRNRINNDPAIVDKILKEARIRLNTLLN